MGVLLFGALWHFTPTASAFLSPWLLLPIPPHCMRALSSATSRDFWQLSTWQGEKESTDSPISASQGCAGLFAKKGQQRDVGRGWHCMLVALKTAALQMPFKLWGGAGGQLHSLHMGHYEMQRSPCPSSASWHCDVTSSLPLPCSFGCLSPHSMFTLQASRGGN